MVGKSVQAVWLHLWVFYMYDFLTDLQPLIFGDLGGPGWPGNPSKIFRGFTPPPFWKVSRPPGAALTPQKIGDCRSAKDHMLKTQVYLASGFLPWVPEGSLDRKFWVHFLGS